MRLVRQKAESSKLGAARASDKHSQPTLLWSPFSSLLSSTSATLRLRRRKLAASASSLDWILLKR